MVAEVSAKRVRIAFGDLGWGNYIDIPRPNYELLHSFALGHLAKVRTSLELNVPHLSRTPLDEVVLSHEEWLWLAGVFYVGSKM